MILFPEKIVLENIIISEKKGNNSKIHYKKGDELVKFKIQTGKMKLPWGPNERKNQNGKIISLNLSVSTFGILDDSNKKRTESFKNSIEKIEELVRKADNVNILNSVIYGPNPDFSPVINLSIPYSDGKPDVMVYDNKKKVVSFDKIGKGSICTFIVKVSHIWYSKNKIGLQLVIESIKIHSNAEVETMDFVSDSDSDGE